MVKLMTKDEIDARINDGMQELGLSMEIEYWQRIIKFLESGKSLPDDYEIDINSPLCEVSDRNCHRCIFKKHHGRNCSFLFDVFDEFRTTTEAQAVLDALVKIRNERKSEND